MRAWPRAGAGAALGGLSAALSGVARGAGRASVELGRGMANVATLLPPGIARVQELKTRVQDLAMAHGRRRRNHRRCSGRSVSIKVMVSSGDAPDRAGWRGGVRRRMRGGQWPSSRFRRRACVGVMARQGRCVAEVGVRDAASRGRRRHAEAWGCPPASFPWPPFGSDSLSSVPPPLPGSFVRAPIPGGAPGRRPDVGGWASRAQWVGGISRHRPGDPRASTQDAVDVVRAGCHGPFGGLPYIEAAQRGGDHGDSSAPGRLVVCQRPFSFGRLDAATPRSAPEIEVRGLVGRGWVGRQTRNDEPKPVGKLDGPLACLGHRH